MKYTHILWDWNGTLLDDVEISIECVNILLKRLGLEPTNLQEYYDMMEIPMKKYYENLFSAKGSALKYELCTENFQNNYPKLINKAKLMDGALEMLEYFKANGAKQYIVSSFEKTRLIKYVKMFKIEHFFEVISGDDDIHVGSKSGRATELVKGVDRDKILYIGDSEADVITANDVGCDCVLICKGHQPRKILEEFGCPVIDNLTELKKQTCQQACFFIRFTL